MFSGRSIARAMLSMGLKSLLRLFKPKTCSANFMVGVEKRKLEASRKIRLAGCGKAPWSGLGLSGGGIRSAALSLGVLQAFAEHDILKRFDYISSVSGGGYLAGSLQWWWTKRNREDSTREFQTRFGMNKDNFPYGPARIARATESETTQRARANLHFLRSHSSYLTPGNGLTSWSMLAVLIRTAMLSILIWIPLLAAFFVLLLVIDHGWLETWANGKALWSPIGGLIPSRWDDACHGVICEFKYRTIYAIGLYIYYGIFAAFVLVAIIFAFMSRTPQGTGPSWSVYSLVALSIVVAVFIANAIGRFGKSLDGSLFIVISIGALFIAIAIATVIAEVATTRSLNASYLLRRWLEKILGQSLIPSLIFLATATIPIVPYFVVTTDKLPGSGVFGGVISILSGIGSAAYAYYTFIRNSLPSLAGQILATSGAILYLYATLVIGYSLSVVWARSDLYGDGFEYASIVLSGLFVIALILSLFANINYVGLHRFYRDRLMEAFMPTDSAVKTGVSTYSPVADNLQITDLKEKDSGSELPPVPYPLINTNVIMINDRDTKVAARGGDNFVVSPLFVGSSVTGWQDSDAYIRNNGPLTLASSVAASGAAATASAGYIGTGITMNPLVAAVMSLLNVRLGLWVSNPSRRWPVPFATIPTFLHPGLISGVLSRRHSRRSRFVELTDGGHFENLGIYELVRRKLSIIVLIDGEADPEISLSSLVSATRRIEQDFQAVLSFDKTFGRGPERLMMYEKEGYPAGLKCAKSPFVVGRIEYNDGTSGTLVYIKSTLIEMMEFTTAGYLAANPTFPHQSTIDQFFDPDQFDAYRYLGYDIGQRVIDSLRLTTTISDADNIWQTYLSLNDGSSDQCERNNDS